MKRLALWMIAGAIFLGVGAVFEAQQSGGAGKTSSAALPANVCKAIEQYIAKIDASRSVKDKGQREERYSEAQTELKSAFKGRDDAPIIAEAEDYARYTEQIANTDPTDTRLTDILDKRLKFRSALLDRCEGYTATR